MDATTPRSLEGEAMLRRISARLFGEDEKPVYLGRFRVLQTLGHGGMGAVYSAEDERLGRVVALKVIRPDVAGSAEERLRLVREARALARLAHPNVVHVHEVGENGDEIFIAMEYVPGKTLDRWLVATSPRLDELLRIFVAVGRGLASAHAAGIVHRDIKPTNVLVGDDGRPRIVDFGLARGVHDGPETLPGRPVADPSRASTDSVAGTPAYMSPEHAQGRPVDARSDQFSFCVTLYEAIYGVVPFPFSAMIVAEHELPAPSLLPTAGQLRVPAWLRRVMARGLALDPRRRFSSIDALVDVVEAEPRRRQRRVLFAGVAVAAMVGTGLLATAGATGGGQCPDGRAAFAETWGPERGAAVRAVFSASPLPYAGRAAARLVDALDGYVDGWVAARRDACEATRVRGEESAALMDRSMLCLERQRRSVAALVELLLQPDVGVITAAEELVSALPRPQACRDPAILLHGPVRATTPTITAADDLLRSVGFLHIARRGGSALPIIATVLAAGRNAGDTGLEAEALLLRGQIEATELRDPQRAAESLHAAAASALLAGRDELTAATWNELARLNARELERRDEAGIWLRYAQSAAQRSADVGLVSRATLLDTESYVALLDERYEAVEALRREALALRERHLAPGDPELTWSRVRVAGAVAERGDLEAALAALSQIVAGLVVDLGADHPTTALVEREVALTLFDLERFTEARIMLTRVRSVLFKLLGPANPHVASVDLTLAQIAASQGDDAALLTHAQAALAVFEALFPPAYSERRAALIELAELYRRTHRYGDSLAVHLALLDVHDRFGADADVPGLLMNIGDSLCNLGRCGESLPYFDRLRVLFTREPPEDGGLVAYAEHGAGLAHLVNGHPDLALQYFEAAYRLLTLHPTTSIHLTGESAQSLAQCLRTLKLEPARARRLEREAADIFRDLGEQPPLAPHERRAVAAGSPEIQAELATPGTVVAGDDSR